MKQYIIKLENKYNPMITKIIVGNNTVDHAFEFCRIDRQHWNIINIEERVVNR